MTCTSSGTLKIHKGETFVRTLRWESGPRIYVPITGITKTGPVVITAEDHGIPNGWRITRITSVKGMTEINTETQKAGVWSKSAFGKAYTNGIKATVIDADTIELNDIDASGFSSYSSGGLLCYNTPIDLTDYTARAQFRATVDAVDPPDLELTTENAGIVINTSLHTITLIISDEDTADLESTVASLELINAFGVVTPIVPLWTVETCNEVTR